MAKPPTGLISMCKAWVLCNVWGQVATGRLNTLRLEGRARGRGRGMSVLLLFVMSVYHTVTCVNG